ncbi:hypothetical protein Avbf_06908 [Armadillidium vulgare]|nr:hypothetical protein Avbf_06908 [Armadillidium vulgare]
MLLKPFPRKPVADLRQLSVCCVVDNLERYVALYPNKSKEVKVLRPKYGPFGPLQSTCLTFIIEEILKRRKLNLCEYFQYLLPEDTESLNCDEITPFSPFDSLKTIKLITKRCPNFKMLHFHTYIENYDAMIFVNDVLSEAIQGLKFLQEINFYDCYLICSTLEIISLNCPNLRELNLHNTCIDDYEVKILLKDESVIKNSLTKLIIDATRIKVKTIKVCLLSLPNLTYFQSDKTIQAALQIFETVKHSAEASDAIPKFKTTVFKNIFFGTNEELLTDDFLKWLVEKFPEVKHLNLLLQEEYNEFASCLISSWKHITHLELSSMGKEESVSALITSIVSCENLITLKLEKFWNVDITPLGNKLKKLEKLTLINNIFVRSQEIQFENLKELQVIFFPEESQEDILDSDDSVNVEDYNDDFYKSYLENLNIPYTLLLSVLSSKNIEKVFFCDQSSFISPLIKDLLERDCLRNLKELKVMRCLIGIDCIWELLRHAIPVTDIVFFCCNISEEDVNKISTFCKENNLAISIKRTNILPYFLRLVGPGIPRQFQRIR